MKTQVIIKKLDAWFVTGFSDGEASFIVSITENKKLNIVLRCSAAPLLRCSAAPLLRMKSSTHV